MSKYSKALEKTGNVSPSESEPDLNEWESTIPIPEDTRVDHRIVTQAFPNSMIAEQYRMLRTSLKNQLEKQAAKVVMVSSSIHGEGKTVTTANLAVALAETGDSKVIVIDADMRRGKLAEYLGFSSSRAGLSNLLMNGLSPQQVMVRNTLDNLLVIPRGEISRHPAELVSSNKFHVLIAELRRHFDYILIDSPPIMAAADAGVLCREVDGVIMVIQVGRTPKNIISHANLLFHQAGVKLLGYVLTNVEFQSADYRYYHYNYQDKGSRKFQQSVSSSRLEKASWNLENRLNQWWENRVSKNQKSNGSKSSAPGEKVANGTS